MAFARVGFPGSAAVDAAGEAGCSMLFLCGDVSCIVPARSTAGVVCNRTFRDIEFLSSFDDVGLFPIASTTPALCLQHLVICDYIGALAVDVDFIVGPPMGVDWSLCVWVAAERTLVAVAARTFPCAPSTFIIRASVERDVCPKWGEKLE